MGQGEPEETDFTRRLRLLVVGENTQHAAHLLAGLEADVVARDGVAGVRRTVEEHAFDCLMLALAGSEPAAIETLDAVLASVPDLPVVLIARGDDASLAERAIHPGGRTTCSSRPSTAMLWTGRSVTRSRANAPRPRSLARRCTTR